MYFLRYIRLEDCPVYEWLENKKREDSAALPEKAAKVKKKMCIKYANTDNNAPLVSFRRGLCVSARLHTPFLYRD